MSSLLLNLLFPPRCAGCDELIPVSDWRRGEECLCRDCRAAWELACRYGVEVPIIEHCYRVCYEGMDPRKALAQLMERPFGMENDAV